MRIERREASADTSSLVRGLAVGIAIVAGGCGGIVADSHSGDGGFFDTGGTTGQAGGTGKGATTGNGGATGKGGGTIGKGGTPGAGGRSGAGATGAAATPGKGTCGDGVIDSGEECDVVLTGTCAAATMGARPLGTLRCAATCTFDTSGCTSGLGSGGFVGTGGVTGQGAFGASVSFDQCETAVTILTTDCTRDCGCKVCPDAYAACKSDGGCAWILACAQQAGCVSVDQCYQTNCKSIIDTAGGKSSPGAKYADPALACLAKNGCGVACN